MAKRNPASTKDRDSRLSNMRSINMAVRDFVIILRDFVIFKLGDFVIHLCATLSLGKFLS